MPNNDYPRSPEAREPPPFPEPQFNPCRRIPTGELVEKIEMFVVEPIRNDNMMDIDSSNYSDSPIAYWTRKRLQRAIYGSIIDAVIVKPRLVPTSDNALNYNYWEVPKPEEHVAIKVIEKEKIDALRNSGWAEDPLKEVAAMQYLKNHFYPQLFGLNNINMASSSLGAFLQSKDQAQKLMEYTRLMTILDVLVDDQHNLYVIMPFCAGLDLQKLGRKTERVFTEGWCRHLLQNDILVAIDRLREAGLCHRDISLENIMMDPQRYCVRMIDMGQALLRVPFENGQRFLIPYLGQFGKAYTRQPEIIEGSCFDGYTVDLWAVGASLLYMLTGRQSLRESELINFRWHFRSQPNFTKIFSQWIENILKDHLGHLNLENGTIQLLRGMLQWNPMDRMSLEQIRAQL